MGSGSSSTRSDLDRDLWDRDIKKLFSCHKIIGKLDFIPIKIITSRRSNKGTINFSYIVLTNNGELLEISEILPNIIFKAAVDKSTSNVIKITDNRFILFGDNVTVADLSDNGFFLTKLAISNPKFAFPVTSGSFTIIDMQSNIYLINDQLTFQPIYTGSTSFEPIAADVITKDKNIVILSTSEHLLIKSLENEAVSFMSDVKSSPYICSNNNDGVFYVPETRDGVFYISINSDLSIKSHTSVVATSSKITALLPTQSVCLLAYDDKSLFCIDPTNSNKFVSEKIPDTIKISSIYPLCQPTLFLITSESGQLFIGRHPHPTYEFRAKGKIDISMISDIHRSKVKCIVSGEDVSFLTVDNDDVAILSENLPKWRNAPHFLNMFENNAANDEDRTSDRY